MKEEQAAIEAQEAAEREAEMKPVFAAQAELNKNVAALYEIEKEAVIAGKPDPGFTLPASVAGKRMTQDAAHRFNREESHKFVANTPEYFPCKQNLQALTDYLLTQSVHIADAETFRVAFERLRYFGLLVERPEPEPEPQAEPEPVDPETERLRRLEEYGSRVVLTHDGIGFTQKALDAMGSEQFAKVNRVPRFSGVLHPERI